MPDPSKRDRRLYTAAQAATLLGVAPRTVASWIDSGKLKGFRLPSRHGDGHGDRRVTHESLWQFMRERGIPLHLLGSSRRGSLLLASADDGLANALNDAFHDSEIVVVGSWLEFGRVLDTRAWQCVILDHALGRPEALAAQRLLTVGCLGRVMALVSEDDSGAECEALGAALMQRRPCDLVAFVAHILQILHPCT